MDSDSSDVDISSDVSIGSPDRPLSSLSSSSSSSDSAEDNVEVEEEAEPPSTAYVNPPSQVKVNMYRAIYQSHDNDR